MYDNSVMFKRLSGSYQKNKIINLNQIKQDKAISIIHAGTKRINDIF